ncbi:thiamine phosphate synthase [Dokdonia sp. Dokd-P16]|uniref:thiamine phosphate synthase n=1 Tax=Dokdonia sp. Dokd-P16 TaxID=2173169 RepID=UPI000D54409E|nr:thiamine phosphate synthase [Dokdonia sp. Dokd-P16]AWH75225.1 thiamine phosphate synthase [Dokdonia sp. Dokd-P16]
MIIVLSPENDIPNEVKILHQLFEDGLACYHVRKPHKSYEDYSTYIQQIDPAFHDRIVVHDHHKVINEFSLKGIHFNEQHRIDHIDNPGKYFRGLNMFGKTISSSFHDLKTLEDCYFEFDYHFLSPVFNSISKEGYNGRGFDVTDSNKTIVALGGIHQENLEQAKKLGYNGIALLGSIWKAENPLQSFKNIKAAFG